MPNRNLYSRHWIKNQQRQALIELSLTIGTIIFFIWFAITPTLSTISQLLKEKQQLTKIDRQLNQKISAVYTATSVYDTNRHKLRFAQEALPDNPQIATTLAQIEILAEQNQLIVRQIDYSQLPIDPQSQYQPTQKYSRQRSTNSSRTDLRTIPWQIQAYGEYSQLLEFLSQIHNFRRLILVDQITIDSELDRETPLLNGRLLLKASGVIPYFPTDPTLISSTQLNN